MWNELNFYLLTLNIPTFFVSFYRLLRKRDSFHLANAEGEIEVLECSFDSESLEEAVKVTVL